MSYLFDAPEYRTMITGRNLTRNRHDLRRDPQERRRKAYEYQADAPVEGTDLFAEFDHTPRHDDVEETTIITTKFDGRRILTKLEFRSCFHQRRSRIDRFEAQFENYAYLTDDQKDTIRTAFKDYGEATQVDLDDPRWVPGLGAACVLGGMDQDEVTEVLRG